MPGRLTDAVHIFLLSLIQSSPSTPLVRFRLTGYFMPLKLSISKVLAHGF